MATVGRIPMRIDAIPGDAILLLTQWVSPAFPVGAFAYSSGLEAAISDGWVDPETLAPWLEDLLSDGPGRSDAIAIRAAAMADNPTDIDRQVRAFAASRERLLEMDAQGAAFCAQLRATWTIETPDLTYPVAFGHGVRAMNLPVDLAVRMYLQVWGSTLIAAAQRLMPLGQTDGQRILATLAPLCHRIADETRNATLADMTSQCLAADIAAMRHETMQPRIFRT